MAKTALLQDARQDWPPLKSLSFSWWLGGAQSLMSSRWHHRATTVQLSWCWVPLHLPHHRISANKKSLVLPGVWIADTPTYSMPPAPVSGTLVIFVSFGLGFLPPLCEEALLVVTFTLKLAIGGQVQRL